jgi:hypothetical protein
MDAEALEIEITLDQTWRLRRDISGVHVQKEYASFLGKKCNTLHHEDDLERWQSILSGRSANLPQNPRQVGLLT